MMVYVATFKQTQDCQEFMCSCKNYSNKFHKHVMIGYVYMITVNVFL